MGFYDLIIQNPLQLFTERMLNVELLLNFVRQPADDTVEVKPPQQFVFQYFAIQIVDGSGNLLGQVFLILIPPEGQVREDFGSQYLDVFFHR